MNVRPRGRRVAVALAGAATALALVAVAGCGGGDDSTASWLGPNADDANTRVASSRIDSSNVADLGIASTEPLTGRGPIQFFAATP